MAAILAADVAGYSRLMGVDEEGTLARLKALRKTLIDSKIAEHRGRIVNAQRQIRGKVDIQFEDIGLQTLKNIAEPRRVSK